MLELFQQFGLLIIFIIIAVITDTLARRKNWQWALIGPVIIIIEAILFLFYHDMVIEDMRLPLPVYFIPFVIYFFVLVGMITKARKEYEEAQKKELDKMRAKDIK